jgi:hypothetical protein
VRGVRDDRHHRCVDREAYVGLGLFFLGWAVAALIEWWRWSWWAALLLAVIAFLGIPFVVLAVDGNHRRAAARTQHPDTDAGGW